MSKTRIDYLDAAKGIGIILVVLGHLVCYNSKLSCIIFSFHMPLFFFISGVLYKDKNNRLFDFVKHKFKTLLVPYLCFWFIALLFFIVKGIIKEFNVKEFLYDIYTGAPNQYYMGSIWFILCLFFVELLFYICYKKLKCNNQVIIILSLFILAYIGANIYKLSDFCKGGVLPLQLHSVPMGLFFYSLGFLLKNEFQTEIFKRQKFKIFMVVSVITLGISWTNGWVNIGVPQYNNFFYYIFFSLSGVIFVLILSLWVKNSKILKFIGRNSMIIFSLHGVFIKIYELILKKIVGYPVVGGNNMNLIQSIIGTLFVLLVLSLAIYVVFLIKKYVNKL